MLRNMTAAVVLLPLIAACDRDAAPGPAEPETAAPVHAASYPGREDTISWAGYQWRVPSARSAPGPTNFSSRNVWVDSNGFLHLRLNRMNGRWYGAYLHMLTDRHRLGFGTYDWDVSSSSLNTLDPNVVFGLFDYPTSDVGPGGTNEIDIEVAKWGNSTNPNLWYVVYPETTGKSNKFLARRTTYPTRFTHRFTWTPDSVRFRTVSSSGSVVASGTIREDASGNAIPQKAMPVHMNLWLYQGKAPRNGKTVEVVIRSFKFTPAGSGTSTTTTVGQEKTLNWAGYTWRVPSARSSPGPTYFNSNNVWVDSNGYLHLRMNQVDGQWYGAYLHMPGDRHRLGFGTYEWRVSSSSLNTLDPNIVFGLFNYPTGDVGPDGTNEIDIEAAKWGNPDNPNLWYVVYPEVSGQGNKYLARRITYPSEFIHRFTWLRDRVSFATVTTSGTVVASGTILEDATANAIPQDPIPVHMNLWQYQGKAPTDGRTVEVVIKSFNFTPQN